MPTIDLARGLRGIAAGMLLLALGACSGIGGNAVVVLPDESGHVGAVVVGEGDKAKVLDSAYATAEVGRGGSLSTRTVQQEDVQRAFGAAMAARPIPPKQFTLLFKLDSEELTPESEATFAALFDDIRRRGTYEVEVVGHTDTLHSQDYNQTLSQQRAEYVRTQLVSRGIAAGSIAAVGRGELDPAVKTPDQTSEPRNRRVEVTVR